MRVNHRYTIAREVFGYSHLTSLYYTDNFIVTFLKDQSSTYNVSLNILIFHIHNVARLSSFWIVRLYMLFIFTSLTEPEGTVTKYWNFKMTYVFW